YLSLLKHLGLNPQQVVNVYNAIPNNQFGGLRQRPDKNDDISKVKWIINSIEDPIIQKLISGVKYRPSTESKSIMFLQNHYPYDNAFDSNLRITMLIDGIRRESFSLGSRGQVLLFIVYD